MINWTKYNFTPADFTCSCCGVMKVDETFLNKLQLLRTKLGTPMIVTSGYRCEKHPIEAKKTKPGSHNSGKAADIRSDGPYAYKIMKLAFELGFTGIGVNQKGGGRFVHLDTIEGSPRPNVWSY